MTEPRLGPALVRQFERQLWLSLATYGLLVTVSFAGLSELTLRRSLERSADLVESLLGLYADPGGERTAVAPAMLADQLVGMGQPFLITRTVAASDGAQTVYFLSPTMPAKRIESTASSGSAESTAAELIRLVTERSGGRYRVLHRHVGEFDVIMAGSRVPYLAGLAGLGVLALILLPVAAWLARRSARRTVAAAVRPLERMIEETHAIGSPSDDSGARVTAPTGMGETTDLADALNRLLERVDRSRRSLEAFTADVSHELRTPLTHLRVQAQWALDGRRTPENLREALAGIVGSVEQMTRMVEDLLLIARGENRQLALERREFDLVPIVREVEEITAAMNQARPVVVVEADLSGPVRAVGDSGRTREILLNLSSNAARHTTEGRISFTCNRRDDMVAIVVSDTGCGIDAADLERIFDRFYRAEPSRSRSHGGSGLGLTIARLLAELQGGRITVESALGRGSAFALWLPAASAPD
ncbi:MAG: ATP-binding protein [Gemmatimonadota bacterium]